MVCSVLVIAGSTDVQLGVGITVVVVVQEYLDCRCGGRHGDGMRCGVWEVVGGAPSDKVGNRDPLRADFLRCARSSEGSAVNGVVLAQC